jgi:hypothetical protein
MIFDKAVRHVFPLTAMPGQMYLPYSIKIQADVTD